MLSIKESRRVNSYSLATSLGTVKKTSLALFSGPRANGIIAVALDDGDKLGRVAIPTARRNFTVHTGGRHPFLEDEVRPWAARRPGARRQAQRRTSGDALIVSDQGYILTASGKRIRKLTPLEDFPKHGRGGQACRLA